MNTKDSTQLKQMTGMAHGSSRECSKLFPTTATGVVSVQSRDAACVCVCTCVHCHSSPFFRKASVLLPALATNSFFLSLPLLLLPWSGRWYLTHLHTHRHTGTHTRTHTHTHTHRHTGTRTHTHTGRCTMTATLLHYRHIPLKNTCPCIPSPASPSQHTCRGEPTSALQSQRTARETCSLLASSSAGVLVPASEGGPHTATTLRRGRRGEEKEGTGGERRGEEGRVKERGRRRRNLSDE